MTGKGQAAEPLTVSLNLSAAVLYTNTFNSRRPSLLSQTCCVKFDQAAVQNYSRPAGAFFGSRSHIEALFEGGGVVQENKLDFSCACRIHCQVCIT